MEISKWAVNDLDDLSFSMSSWFSRDERSRAVMEKFLACGGDMWSLSGCADSMGRGSSVILEIPRVGPLWRVRVEPIQVWHVPYLVLNMLISIVLCLVVYINVVKVVKKTCWSWNGDFICRKYLQNLSHYKERESQESGELRCRGGPDIVTGNIGHGDAF